MLTAALIPFAGLAVSRWRNGAGRKADIAAGPDWLLGYAWLDADAPFSDYAGYDRTITLIEGPGFILDFGPSHARLLARRPHAPSAFDGGWPARCRVPDGPCMVLNAMTARSAWTHRVTVATANARVTPGPAGWRSSWCSKAALPSPDRRRAPAMRFVSRPPLRSKPTRPPVWR